MVSREKDNKMVLLSFMSKNYHENPIWAKNVDLVRNRSTCMIIISTSQNNYIFHFKNKLKFKKKIKMMNTKE